MTVKTKAQLAAAANLIRNEVVIGANTKERVATMLQDIADANPLDAAVEGDGFAYARGRNAGNTADIDILSWNPTTGAKKIGAYCTVGETMTRWAYPGGGSVAAGNAPGATSQGALWLNVASGSETYANCVVRRSGTGFEFGNAGTAVVFVGSSAIFRALSEVDRIALSDARTVVTHGGSTGAVILREQVGTVTSGAVYLGVAAAAETAANFAISSDGVTTRLNSGSATGSVGLRQNGIDANETVARTATTTDATVTTIATLTLAPNECRHVDISWTAKNAAGDMMTRRTNVVVRRVASAAAALLGTAHDTQVQVKDAGATAWGAQDYAVSGNTLIIRAVGVAAAAITHTVVAESRVL